MREIVTKILQWQAQKYLLKNKPKVVAVTGSIGKTSTTQAIAAVLSEKYSVRKTRYNYNTSLGIPCSIFDNDLPSNVKNPFSWLLLIIKNQISLYRRASFEFLVLEFGTDSPGDIVSYSWVEPDISVTTAVADEHMEYFKTIEAVAKEELSVAEYSDKVLINKNMVDKAYLKYVNNDQVFNYSRDDIKRINLNLEDLNVVGEHSIDAVVAAVSVGKVFGLQNNELIRGAKAIVPISGRMQKLKGIKNSTIIDDTYNSSPAAVLAALDYIYSTNYENKIVLLGNMNELGNTSAESHKKIGEYCDPEKLDLVITLGEEANRFTADAAKNKGNSVAESLTPYEAAEIIKNQIKEDTIVLCKGSQNGVFAEESVKLLLANPEDSIKLVRQSKSWMKKKQRDFRKDN